MTAPAAPEISVLVIVHDMVRQALNTLTSLSVPYQQNISVDDYEVIIVENRSAHCLDPEQVQRILPNSRYVLRDESGSSPVHAINEGFALCRAPMIGLMIDGARMLSPRVLEYARMAHRMDPEALVAVPGYNLGPVEHQLAHEHGHTQAKEEALLKEIDWQHNGYRLFDISSLGGANPTGVINPLLESNCVFASKTCFGKIGWADTEFSYPGGGSLNLHMFRSLGMLPDTRHYFILPGEGSFHQLHGGVTTRPREDREQLLKQFARQINKRWGVFSVLKREPILLGAVTAHAQRFLEFSCREATVRFNRLDEKQTSHWIDDVTRETTP